MAVPPFLPNQVVPANTDAVSPFPSIERLFREIIRDWLLYEHDISGHHKFAVVTTAQRNALVGVETGTKVWNLDHNCWQWFNGSWVHAGFQPGVSIILRAQSLAAPIGWVLDNGVPLDFAALRSVTGMGGGQGGSVGFDVVLNPSRTVTGSVAGHVLTLSEIPSHNHTFDFVNATISLEAGGVRAIDDVNPVGLVVTGTTDTVGGGAAHSHSWTGAVNLDIKFFDTYRAFRNAA